MKQCLFFGTVILLLVATSAQTLDGRVIVVSGGEDASAFAPVTVDCDEPAPDGRVEAINRETGDVAPVTIHAGRLTFVPPAIAGNVEQRFELQVQDQADAPRVRLEHDADAGTVAVYVRDEHFTTYNFGEEHRIPFLWPVHAEGGIAITRNYPLGSDEPVESTDHRHHVSMWIAYGDVNGYDTWHRVPIKTQTVEAGSGDALGVIEASNVWCDNGGNPIVDEAREYRFYDGPAGVRLIDQKITFTAAYGDVTFGDDKEGFVAFRIRPEIQGNQAGVLTNAAGSQGERAVYGTPMPWMDYSGPVEGVGNRGIALFSHPDNFRQPCWHVRNYGLVGANPFALSDVAKLAEDGSHTLEEGDSMTFMFRVYIHSGDVEEAQVARYYADYAEGPTAVWAE